MERSENDVASAAKLSSKTESDSPKCSEADLSNPPKRPFNDEGNSLPDDSIEAKKMKWDDVKCEEVNSERNEPGSSVVDNDRDDKCEAVTTNDSARDQSYSTENFKIEIFGLPKHTGYGQLKKYLKNLNLEPRKVIFLFIPKSTCPGEKSNHEEYRSEIDG